MHAQCSHWRTLYLGFCFHDNQERADSRVGCGPAPTRQVTLTEGPTHVAHKSIYQPSMGDHQGVRGREGGRRWGPCGLQIVPENGALTLCNNHGKKGVRISGGRKEFGECRGGGLGYQDTHRASASCLAVWAITTCRGKWPLVLYCASWSITPAGT